MTQKPRKNRLIQIRRCTRNYPIIYKISRKVPVNELVKSQRVINLEQRERPSDSRTDGDNRNSRGARSRVLDDNFSRNCADRRLVPRVYARIILACGPRATLLPPDIYEPLSSGLSLWAARGVQITGGILGGCARRGVSEGLGYYLLIPSNERTNGSHHRDHRGNAIKNETWKIAQTSEHNASVPSGTRARARDRSACGGLLPALRAAFSCGTTRAPHT